LIDQRRRASAAENPRGIDTPPFLTDPPDNNNNNNRASIIFERSRHRSAGHQKLFKGAHHEAIEAITASEAREV
jgi:hypothetical protein